MLRLAAAAVTGMLTVAVVAVPAGSVFAAPADPQFAPPGRPGPELTASADQLAASLQCTGDLVDASRAPVLLLSGTGNNTGHNFGWNWKPALSRAGIPWCTSDIPGDGEGNRNYGDMQLRGEYITYAIRTIHEMAGRRISIVGHSQGGTAMRWSLRFWPDTRAMVDDIIGMAPPNHGTEYVSLYCLAQCQPALWQLAPESDFMAVLNSHQETFRGISYTTIRTDFDTIVVPPTSAELDGPGQIANLRIQDLCPARPTDHVSIGTFDAVAEAFVMDALDHPGPADLSRIDADVCYQPVMSGVSMITLAADLAAASAAGSESAMGSSAVTAEPPLRDYVWVGPGATAGGHPQPDPAPQPDPPPTPGDLPVTGGSQLLVGLLLVAMGLLARGRRRRGAERRHRDEWTGDHDG